MTLAAQTIASQSEDLGAARRAMIDSQLRVSGINQDWLLAVLARVPREDHVPAAARGTPISTARSPWTVDRPCLHRWSRPACWPRPSQRPTKRCW